MRKDPGFIPYLAAFRKHGYVAASKQLSVAGGLVESLNFDLAAKPKEGAPEPPPRRLGPHAQANAGMGGGFWMSIVCAGAFAGAAGAFGVMTGMENRKLGNELGTYPANQGYVSAERSRVKSFALLSDVFGAGAILALGSGAYFAIRGGSRAEAANGSTPPRQLQAVWTGTGVLLQGDL